jgi:hypothetical protein
VKRLRGYCKRISPCVSVCVAVLGITASVAASASRATRRDLHGLGRSTLSLFGGVVIGVTAVVTALCIGLALHALAIWLRDSGPAWGGISFRGNGALVVLFLAAAVLIAGEVVAFRRRAWLAMLLIPVALFAGLFLARRRYLTVRGDVR